MGVSLRVVIAALITFATIIATLIAFIPTYLSGVAAVRSTLGDLRGAYVGQAAEGIDAFFDIPIATLSEVHNAVNHDMLNLTDTATWSRWLTNYTYNYYDSINAATLRLWAGIEQSYPLYLSIDNRYIPGTSTIITTNATFVNAYYFDAETYTVLPEVLLIAPLPSTFRTHAEITARANPSASVIWTPVYMGYETPQLSATLVIADKTAATPTARGCISAELTPASLVLFFESLHLRSGARALVVDGNSGLMLGNTWGEATEELFDLYRNPFAPEHLRMKMKTLFNHSDSTILRAVGEIGGDRILNGDAPFATDLYSGHDLTYVNVIEVTGPGLRLRLLLVMPEIDFMEDVYASQISTSVTVAVVVLLVISLGIALAIVLVRPLVELQERMELTASLKDTEDDDGSLSIFTEVGDMQQSYQQMKAELNRMKSYLPQSVLFPNNTEEDDEEEEGGEISPVASTANRSVVTGAKSASGGSSSQASRGSQRGTPGDQSHRSSSANPTISKKLSVYQLNTRGEVAHKRVTVAVFNLKDFHQTGNRSVGVSAMISLQKEFLQLIQKTTREHKGVLDVFQGDHVTCSFNAVGNCPASNRRATLVALHVVETFRAHRVTVGIAGGTAFVGNMGTDEMRRFCIVGPVIPQAMALERLTKQYGQNVRILISQSMFEDIAIECKYAVVDRIRLPGSKTPQMLGAVLELQAASGDEEWMYDLEDNAAADPFQLLNQAWGLIRAGRAEVMAKLTEVDRELESIPLDTADLMLSSPSSTSDQISRKSLKSVPTPGTKGKTISNEFRDIISDSSGVLHQLVIPFEEGLGWNADGVHTDLGQYFSQCV